MRYIQVAIKTNDAALKEILVALLTEMNFEGFEEQEDLLNAYIPEDDYRKDDCNAILEQYGLQATISELEKTNWNKEWETHFEPVVVDDFCAIRADFHAPNMQALYEITITPKMSFGTGHHATTQLMIRMMRNMELADKSVLDFGTGTGVLAILASMMGAKNVCALDNDQWSYENALENAVKNNADINVVAGSLEDVEQTTFDIILANINRHILLRYMNELYNKVNSGGQLLMSGLLADDRSVIIAAASEAGFSIAEEEALNGWIYILVNKF